MCMIYDFQSAPKDPTAKIVQRHVCIQSMDGYATKHVIVSIFNIATLLMVDEMVFLHMFSILFSRYNIFDI